MAKSKVTSKRVLGWATKALQVGSEVADIAVHLQRGVGPLGVIAVGARVLHTVQKLVPRVETEWFVEQGWKLMAVPSELLPCVQAAPAREISASRTCSRWVYEVCGQRVGLRASVLPASEERADVWMPPGTDEKAWHAAIGRCAWEHLGGTAWAIWSYNNEWESGEDLLKEALPSEAASRVYEEAKLFLSKGLSRSILFHGPPGVGKSHLMRRVRDLVGGYSLRIEAAVLSHYPADCHALVRILRPDVVLVDDIDRTEEDVGEKGQTTLEFLENIRDSVKLVVASANFLDEMDPASLRAGRWDQLVEITSLDEGVIDGLIGEDVPAKYRGRLRALPVAYIHEFHRRRAVLGLELALESIEQLVAQAAKVDELCKRRQDR